MMLRTAIMRLAVCNNNGALEPGATGMVEQEWWNRNGATGMVQSKWTRIVSIDIT